MFSCKSQRLDRPQLPRFHHHFFKKYRGLFKFIFDLLGFTYVLRLSTIIQELLRVHHRIFRFYNDRDWKVFWTRQQNVSQF